MADADTNGRPFRPGSEYGINTAKFDPEASRRSKPRVQRDGALLSDGPPYLQRRCAPFAVRLNLTLFGFLGALRGLGVTVTRAAHLSDSGGTVPLHWIHEVGLTSGARLEFPIQLIPELKHASPRDIRAVEALGRGSGLHRERLNVNLSVPGLVASVLQLEQLTDHDWLLIRPPFCSRLRRPTSRPSQLRRPILNRSRSFSTTISPSATWISAARRLAS
jgi:hypothetical protein